MNEASSLTTGAEFVIPDVWPGCLVEFSVGKTRANRVLGTVTRKKTRAVDIQVTTERGLAMFRDCWHEDDPWVDSREADVWEDGDRGTWRLAQGEIRARAMVFQLEELRRRVAALELQAVAPAPETPRPAAAAPQDPSQRPGYRWKRPRVTVPPVDSTVTVPPVDSTGAEPEIVDAEAENL